LVRNRGEGQQGSAASAPQLLADDTGPDGDQSPAATRVTLRPHDPTTGEEIDKRRVVKGYEYARGEFVTFTAEELKALDVESSKVIDYGAAWHWPGPDRLFTVRRLHPESILPPALVTVWTSAASALRDLDDEQFLAQAEGEIVLLSHRPAGLRSSSAHLTLRRPPVGSRYQGSLLPAGGVGMSDKRAGGYEDQTPGRAPSARPPVRQRVFQGKALQRIGVARAVIDRIRDLLKAFFAEAGGAEAEKAEALPVPADEMPFVAAELTFLLRLLRKERLLDEERLAAPAAVIEAWVAASKASSLPSPPVAAPHEVEGAVEPAQAASGRDEALRAAPRAQAVLGALSSIARGLDERAWILGAELAGPAAAHQSHPGKGGAKTELPAETGEEGGVEPQDVPTAGSPSEASLVFAATERFLASRAVFWAFTIAVGALTLAAAFAIGGSIAIGSKTFEVRQDLDKASADAKKDIADRQKGVLDELDRRQNEAVAQYAETEKAVASAKENAAKQAAEIETTRRALEQGRKSFDEVVASGQNAINAIRIKHEAEMSALVEGARREATQRLFEDVEKEKEGVRRDVVARLSKVVDVDLKGIGERLAAISASADELQKSLGKEKDDLAKAGPGLIEVKAVALEGGALKAAAQKIREDENETRGAKELASAQARAAQEAAGAAARSRENVENGLKKAQEQLAERQKDLGRMEERLDAVKKNADAGERVVAQLKAAAPQALAEIEKRNTWISALDQDITTVDATVKGADAEAKRVRGVIEKAGGDLFALAVAGTTAEKAKKRIEEVSAEVDLMKGDSDRLKPVVDDVDKTQRRLASVQERLGKVETSLAEACEAARRIAAKSLESLALGDRIRTMQQGLAKLGFDQGGVDGAFGPKMRAAVEAYQRSRGEPTGRLTSAQETALLRAGAPQEPSGCTP
jgi:hypothetical protein